MAISNITKDTTRYTVVKGDTFSEIAQQCVKVNMSGYSGLSLNAAMNKLATFNPDIENRNLIYINQVIILQGTAAKKTTNNTQRAKITNFGLQSHSADDGGKGVIFATWSWNKNNTDHYEVRWKYTTGDGVAFQGKYENVTEKQSLYSEAPNNATQVTFQVRPISKTYKSGNKEVKYWTADWSTVEKYSFSDNPPGQPPKPSDITIKDSKLTVKLTDLSDLNATEIQFQIVKNDTTIFKTGNAKIGTAKTATYKCAVDPGCYYRVRCRSVREKVYSEWSEYSDEFTSAPAASAGIYSIKALTELSNQPNQFVVGVYWYGVSGADSYEVQYTTQETYFDSNPSAVTSLVLGSTDDPVTVDHTEISGLAGGMTYFFRVRSITNGKNAPWCDVEAITLGEKPTAPTTWSSTTTVVSGKPLTLYWVHNSIDGSSQTWAKLELTINGVVQPQIDIQNSVDPDEKDKISSYIIDTTSYSEGVKIKWKVKTAGILINDETGNYEYSDWSIEREVDVYAEPSVSLTVTNVDDVVFEELTSFPIHISAYAGPSTQKPIGFHLTVTSNEKYETVDNIGDRKIINAGSSVYYKYFDANENPLEVTLTAGDLNLSNNMSYTITCSVCMNSGLTAEETTIFTVAWEDSMEVWPNAEIVYDPETVTTSIRPYCEDENGQLIDGVILSVYRREFDGRFTELATELNNTDSTYITDPHPSLDYARYRIVATSVDTGAVSYYDMPGYPIDEPSVILQWDEEWTNFNITNEDGFEEQYWSGSLLKLKYNIDVSDFNDKKVELVEYEGRDHPVSYYGTQLGHTASWAMEIEKDDIETIYALRRLARWKGDVYVREPSGSGYWANVTVSFSRKHRELTIPVTLEISRVEGGI